MLQDDSSKADAIFHPLRMRIVQALFGDRRLTAQQIADVLGGVAMATLYRHLNRLTAADVVAIVEERPIRGSVEKVYALANAHAATFTAEELLYLSVDEQQRNFKILIGTLVGDYERYLAQPSSSPPDDVVVTRQKALYLSDDEARALSDAIKAAFAPYIDNPLTPERRRRMLTYLLMPVVEPPPPPSNAS